MWTIDISIWTYNPFCLYLFNFFPEHLRKNKITLNELLMEKKADYIYFARGGVMKSGLCFYCNVIEVPWKKNSMSVVAG